MNNFINNLRAVRLTWKCDKKYFVIKIGMVVVSAAFSFVSLYLAKMLVDQLTGAVISYQYIVALVLAKLAVDVVGALLGMLQNKYYPVIEVRLSYQIQEELIRTVAKADYANFDMPEFYDAMENALRETNGLTKSIDAILNIFSGIFNFVIALLLCIKFDYMIPLILVFGLLPYYLVKSRMNKYQYDISKEINAIGRKTMGIRHLLTSKYYAHEVRSYDWLDFLISRYRGFAKERIGITEKSNRKTNNYSFICSICNLIVGVLASFRLIFLFVSRLISWGDYILVQSYILKMQSSLHSTVDCLLNISERNLYLNNLFRFIDIAGQSAAAKGTLKLKAADSYKVEFRHVSFRYPNNDRKILEDVSFVLQSGETALLIGENGAGKSTLLNLLNAFYGHYEGEILIDDVDIKEYDPESLWKNISIMFQGGSLIPMTLRDNISCGKTIEECFGGYPWFQELVTKYPKGLDTNMMTYMFADGIEPSGGEIQRIKLMRALMKTDTGILVLDEPTNAVDPETEYQILRSMKEVGRGKTKIIVSHNLSCATYVDKVIHLKEGRVIEMGSHKELLGRDGEYARLFKLQAEKYLEK